MFVVNVGRVSYETIAILRLSIWVSPDPSALIESTSYVSYPLVVFASTSNAVHIWNFLFFLKLLFFCLVGFLKDSFLDPLPARMATIFVLEKIMGSFGGN